MIISLFGPDGVGKSTIARALQSDDWVIFSGTNVASWPDQTWHNELLSQGIDDTSIEKDEHFLEKIRRVHELARSLEKLHSSVIIDSNPLHKTLIHDYLRALPDAQAGKHKMRQRYPELATIARLPHNGMVHVYCQVSDTLDDWAQARLLQERVSGRGELAHFDPVNLEASFHRIQASKELQDILIENGQRVITVATDRPFDISMLRNV